jgi:hypothetical protein
MGRFVAAALTLVLVTPVLLFPAASQGSDRALPMHFSLHLQGPGESCAPNCRTLISASGAITANTAQDFKAFARDRDLTDAIVVLDSNGGSVHGAIALGREIRRLGLDTTVGRLADLGAHHGTPRAKLIPRADCESMCAFVLVAGVHRTVPSEARVMVHQIWLGDRRDDPTAANYSAEDLVLVQRDIGRLARYTADMGASIELLDLALRIPPWEPMHALTRAEILRTRVETPAPDAVTGATIAASPGASVAPPVPPMTDGARATATTISEQHWAVIDRAGTAVLARRHPLTIEGEIIGSFDLMIACGADGYDVSYIEQRHIGARAPLPGKVGSVTVAAGRSVAKLKVVSSERRTRPDELVTLASGNVPAKLIWIFAGAGKHSMLIVTKSAATVTAIRLGNTGARQNFPRLSVICGKGDRAALPLHTTHGLALAN